MNPDGTVNTVGWHDFSERSVHVLAEKSKATAKAFYGKVHKFAYWDGYSTGGSYDPTKDAGVLCTSEVSTVRDFYRFYLIPGFGHREPVSGKTFVPLPQSAAGRDEMFTALQKWVENGTIPGRMDVTSADATASLPLCVYPQKITYLGTGPVKSAANYTCS